jgi:hypothetical protein
MENLNDLGIHVFEKGNKLDWELELLTVNLLSALSWKNFHGPIKLYCNTGYKEAITYWGIDSVYDEINTELLDNKPQDIDYKQYWAFGKLLVIEHLKDSGPFTMVDTDLWINEKLNLNKDSDVIVYHKENFSIDYHNNTYPDFDFLIPDDIKQMDLDKSVLPTNCALLHIKDLSFITEWIELAKQIAQYNKDIEVPNKNGSSKMCFVEQRLLPMILKKNRLKHETFIGHIYQSHLSEPQDGSEWLPRFENSTDEMIRKFESIKHVWGLKKFFHYPDLKYMVMASCLDVLDLYPTKGQSYSKIYNYMSMIYPKDVSQSLAS